MIIRHSGNKMMMASNNKGGEPTQLIIIMPSNQPRNELRPSE